MRTAFLCLLLAVPCLATVIQGPLLNADGTMANCSISATPFTGSPTVIRYQVVRGTVAFALNPGMYNVVMSCQSQTVTVKSYTFAVPDTAFVNITDLLGGPVLTNDQTIPIVALQTGTTGALVGTSDTQVLTNKTIDGISPATAIHAVPTHWKNFEDDSEN